jgi:hypothetical protein
LKSIAPAEKNYVLLGIPLSDAASLLYSARARLRKLYNLYKFAEGDPFNAQCETSAACDFESSEAVVASLLLASGGDVAHQRSNLLSEARVCDNELLC